ncbi:hypothetical protein BUALT_Bualt04G0094500 [Buddleja alternifolia]|uniref:BHLH domain-containing protein n=1 Tax=Buddleja alternifolia TaxID=168488 RepID=A0AAV6XVR2_9LAMI|nr:hypothetical protein BUALT_Bualt04G0094500 [Buddleja alternifolia]
MQQLSYAAGLTLSLQEMDNSMFMNQYDFIDSFDEDLAALAFGQDFHNYVSPGSNSSSPSYLINTPNTNSFNSYFNSPEMQQAMNYQNPGNYSNYSNIHNMINPDPASSAPFVMSFNENPSENLQQVNANPEEKDVVVPEVMISPGSNNVSSKEDKKKAGQSTKKKTRIRPPSQTYDHIIAERKRREQLSQLFVALSAIVPGLKKMDKSSVLEDAIKYLKHLKERVKHLEEQAEKQAMESVVMVRKSQIVVEDEGSSDEISGGTEEQPLPEIEAKVCDNHILLRIHCEKQKGVLVKLLSKVESLNMSVVSTNATPFGDVSLDITIIAEMEKEFNLTVKEVLMDLRAALQAAA